MSELTLKREEVVTLAGYIAEVVSIAQQNPLASVEPDDEQRDVLAKLEAVTTAPES